MGTPKTIKQLRQVQNTEYEDIRRKKEIEKIQSAYSDACKLENIIRKEVNKGRNLGEAVRLTLNSQIVLKTYSSLQEEWIRNKVINLIRNKLYKETYVDNRDGSSVHISGQVNSPYCPPKKELEEER